MGTLGGSTIWDPPSNGSENSSSLKIWDYSDSEAAPAFFLVFAVQATAYGCRKEACPEGLDGVLCISLYTNEGKGRQDRKLAIAHHKRRNGKSELTIAQNVKGILSHSDDSFIGSVNANLMGSKYHIWDQGSCPNSLSRQSKSLLAVVSFTPTILSWTGSYRRLRACIAKHQSMQLKNTAQVQHIKGLPKEWEEKTGQSPSAMLKGSQLQYSRLQSREELGLESKVQLRDFQLTLEENGKQTILQLGRVGKSKYVMDYRYPLTGYQAFCICLASIDSKLCCTV
ncbi:tubby like protein 8 [Prunus dulcis]|uniref:Tubby like protein 8 n=1 Tax=Prunus dulcis TaxID=3755 RepID=A0A4Y1R568_PRUDU|nr:tubby like protein 8 [Prunus dulcis]